MKNRSLAFGEFVRELRGRERLGLREFCLKTGIDPSNWSKMERGINAPPQDETTLTFYAASLGLQQGADDWQKFFDLAVSVKGMIPSDLREDEFVTKLPAFFRTIRRHDVTPDELDKIIRFVKRDYGIEEGENGK